MALHKIVNGVKIDLSPEEETALRAEWEANRIERERKRIEHEELKLKKEKIVDKLLISLTEEEKTFIKPFFINN